MATSHKILCRPCEIPFVVVSKETRDVECPSCGVWLEGGVLAAFLNYEHRKIVTEAIAEISPLGGGKFSVVLRRNLIEHLRKVVLIKEIAD